MEEMSQNDLKMWDISMDWVQGKSTGNQRFFPIKYGDFLYFVF